ncbi:hypothetical protein TPDSL_23270 [Terrisporobacter petrolearius]|uniref:AAA family ATPase n=1 Tax=Terrisporobacter petrolearius TaxID=1460447 RepID=UPI0033695003
MKTITLNKLEINNFKGISNLSIDFAKVTNIKGENALGKTSIFDAFTWLLFDKDSKDRKDFDVRPLGANNNIIRGLNPHVVAYLSVDSKEIKLTKTLKEKWSRAKSESERKFTGNETIYEINDVPVKKSEYTKKISEIVDEKQFKLLTNPYLFSNLNWKEARAIILEIAGDVSMEQVFAINKDLKAIEDDLKKDDVENILKSRNASIKKLKEEKKSIPYKIEEANNSIQEIDFAEIEAEIGIKENQVKDIDRQLSDVAEVVREKLIKNKEIMAEMQLNNTKIQNYKNDAYKITEQKKQELYSKKESLTKELYSIESTKNKVNYEVDNLRKTYDRLEKEIAVAKQEWRDEKSKEICLDGILTECPTCKRPFESAAIEDKKQEMLENFNSNKAKRIKEIGELGKSKTKELEEINKTIGDKLSCVENCSTEIVKFKNDIEEVEKEIEDIKPSIPLITQENIDKLEAKNIELESILNSTSGNENVTNYSEEKDKLNSELKTLYSKLAVKELNAKTLARIEDLKEQEKELGTEIARQEKIVMLCEEFIKTRVDLLEANINHKFKNVKFKLFKENINGSLEETCEPLVEGVPFKNANTASQINAGLDIINTLSEFYEASVPVFIDNRESINQLIDINSQVINLIVTQDNPMIIEALEAVKGGN